MELAEKQIHRSKKNRIEILEINPHIYGQIIYNKRAKNILQRKDSIFNKWC